MNATTKHTPGSLIADPEPTCDGSFYLQATDTNGEVVAIAEVGGEGFRDTLPHEANAREIARRWNTHGALLSMLEQILEHPDASIPCQTEAEARDLLRLARGS